jgi:hypothetical protein
MSLRPQSYRVFHHSSSAQLEEPGFIIDGRFSQGGLYDDHFVD